EIKSMGVMSVARINGAISAVFGLILGIISFFIISLRFSLLGGIASLIISPILLGIIGFILGAVSTWIYNLVAERFGGYKIGLNKGVVESIEIVSYMKIQALLGAIFGFIG